MRRPYHHGDLKEAVLSAAMAKIESDGVAALSLRDLARECGVSPSAPQKHFATKQDLLLALALRGYADLGDVVAGLKLELPVESALMALGEAYCSYVAEHPVLIQLMYAPPSEGGVEPREEAFRRAFRPLEEVLDLARERGDIVKSRKLVDTFVHVVLRGLGTSVSSGFFGMPDDAISRSVVRLMLTGLQPR
ncbi:TetR/AcrR family transcriptional regulator [Mycolicibacterium goodii]|uniref:TetR/AcrR family transcriptional regulator n=1 Tax=Mycolicibacterium goodii TaxID=134601 RepID=UPI001BDDA27F|nr:TetR/AcrR family transcriptional regulator [Mycolicibacterium goodii]MBU8817979.1 TetR/AcrR family transcriptional regulator [Mycolicibacterium goodii]